MLKNVFITLLLKYSNDLNQIESLWNSIYEKYSNKKRYYHNLSHLEHLYSNLHKVRNLILDWDIVLFALFYHDYIYNVLKQDNEEQSALKAIEILNLLGIDKDRVSICNEIILATKGHNISENSDVNYFTDADLAILGNNWNNYMAYYKNVRKEYKYYPHFMYKKGRIKVLQHFIEMPRIFKTDHFYSQLERQAKENLQQEISLLSK